MKILKENKKTHKQMALDTLETVKEIYDADESGILVASFWGDFMAEVEEQIREIKDTIRDDY